MDAFASWMQAIALARPENKPEVFQYAARGLLKEHPRIAVADFLRDCAIANNLEFSENRLQAFISEIIEKGESTAHDNTEALWRRTGNGNGHSGKQEQPIPITSLFPILPDQIPTRRWLVPGSLLRRNVTVLIAPPGSGKSLLTLQIAIMCSAGLLEWSGWKPRAIYRTLLINVEEDRDEMQRRAYAAVEKMNVSQDDLVETCIFAEAATIVVAKADSRTKTVVATPMLEQIIDVIKEKKIDICIVDPFAETFSGDENSNSELKWCAVLWREVARRADCAILLVHHAKKYSSNMAGDMDASRGGGSLAGVARIVSTLFGMTPEEASAMDVDEDERNRFIRYDDAKANMSLVSLKAKWFKKESIKLENGADGIPGDEVGVLVPWSPPSIFDKMDTNKVNEILDDFKRGIVDDSGRPTGDGYKISRKGGTKRWAGDVLMMKLGCSDNDAKHVLKTWQKNGLIEERNAPSACG